MLVLPAIGIDKSLHMRWHALDQDLLAPFKSHAITPAHVVLGTLGANKLSQDSS